MPSTCDRFSLSEHKDHKAKSTFSLRETMQAIGQTQTEVLHVKS